MKRMVWMAAASLILLGASIAAAQSLGDYARTARKTKPQTASTSRHYDNDNLPRNEHLSVVGPEAPVNTDNPPAPTTTATADNPPASATANAPADASKTNAKDPKAEATNRQKATEALQKKIDEKKQKLDALNHELDLSQREFKLRAAAMYSDAGNRLRNAALWDKEDSRYQQDIAEKQKAIAAARQELESAQEEGRKAGLKQKDQE
jgi:hypothetical protein